MAKKDKVKGSKKIAGVKLPKAVRKGPLAALLTSQLGREILADALIAAAAAAAAALVKNRPTAAQLSEAGKAAAEAGADAAAATRDAVHDAAGVVAGIVTEAARHILPGPATGTRDEPLEADTKRYRHLAGGGTGKKDKGRGRASKH
ncbi:MAG TPA: hypothetical protein VH743_10015 [Beijerinckiaceae bacterium]